MEGFIFDNRKDIFSDVTRKKRSEQSCGRFMNYIKIFNFFSCGINFPIRLGKSHVQNFPKCSNTQILPQTLELPLNALSPFIMSLLIFTLSSETLPAELVALGNSNH